MDTENLCEYVKHYLEEDKTQSAIMLDGEWGTGKSYFVEHELVPFLDKNGNHQCVVISLYGLNDISEISKSIYFDLRIKHVAVHSEAAKTGVVIANTVTKGITSFFGVDLSADETKLQELYESVDMTNKLLVLEDLERTNIPLPLLMGYINNMVEHDKVKVLLIANESAIVGEKPSKEGVESHNGYTKNALEYLTIKEKTVSDTLQFNCNLENAIGDIIGSYGQSLDRFHNVGAIQDIVTIMGIKSCYNLRSFLFSCQKTVDIFQWLPQNINDNDFIKAIFYGTVAFSFKWKENKDISWDGNEHASVNLGVANYPLFKFCYDFIREQKKDIEEISKAQAAFEHMRRFDVNKSRDDPDILTLYNYFLRTESEVRDAVKSIEKRLQNSDDISYYEYGSIIVYSLEIHDALGISIENIKDLIIKNLEGQAKNLNQEQIFRIGVDPRNEDVYAAFHKIKSQMIASMNKSDQYLFGLDYIPENAKKMHDYLLKNRAQLCYNGKFIIGLNPVKFAQMFLHGNAEQMYYIRGILLTTYSDIEVPSNSERDVLIAIRENVKKGRNEVELDKIQQLHYDWFIEHLNKKIDSQK